MFFSSSEKRNFLEASWQKNNRLPTKEQKKKIKLAFEFSLTRIPRLWNNIFKVLRVKET